ncbi:hypothetical protein [Alloscardovia macacae]|uniref:Uncharacterized protein n=1 Tax=Alloscardovia macacae TaxID=1160091 RepID=A0A261F1T0_9BIFI|nr:hypothetical protein [Alloscardovia macacae]OZG53082.1 hypothetical protein ALMA_1384 [Alloscardovia macacae]
MSEFDYSHIPDDQLRRSIALLTVLQENAKTAIDAAKAEAVRREIGLDQAEDVHFNGQSAGTLSYSKATEGSYYVDDPIAYAYYLQRMGYEVMTEELPYPKCEAWEKSFLKARVFEDLFDTQTGLIVKASGQMPDGVKKRAGRGETVVFKKNKSVTAHLFEIATPDDVVKLISGTENENA